jgi:hypothetical protein
VTHTDDMFSAVTRINLFQYIFILLLHVTHTDECSLLLNASISFNTFLFYCCTWQQLNTILFCCCMWLGNPKYFSCTWHLDPLYFDPEHNTITKYVYVLLLHHVHQSYFLSHTCIIQVCGMFKLNRLDCMICIVYACWSWGQFPPDSEQDIPEYNLLGSTRLSIDITIHTNIPTCMLTYQYAPHQIRCRILWRQQTKMLKIFTIKTLYIYFFYLKHFIVMNFTTPKIEISNWARNWRCYYNLGVIFYLFKRPQNGHVAGWNM